MTTRQKHIDRTIEALNQYKDACIVGDPYDDNHEEHKATEQTIEWFRLLVAEGSVKKECPDKDCGFFTCKDDYSYCPACGKELVEVKG